MDIKSTAMFAELQGMAQQVRPSPGFGQEMGIEQRAVPGVGNSSQADFSAMLKGAIDNVNELAQTTGDLRTRMEMGDPSVTLEQTMLASQKSSIAFEATVQVRNKMVEAYKEIMAMPV